MRDYTITLDIESGGYSIETEVEVTAYSVEEANSEAESKVFDNIGYFTNIKDKEEDNTDYEVTVSIEFQGYSMDNTISVNAYSEAEASECAIEKIRDNLTVNATDYQCEDEDNCECD